MSGVNLSQEQLNQIFPLSRTSEFFDALYGDAEDGAYDIILTSRNITPERADMAFELRRRPGQCLKCSLTYGLPEVFKKHPIININKIANDIGEALGWEKKPDWKIYPVEEIDDNLHIIPLVLEK